MAVVQLLEPGLAMQGWRPFGSDGQPILRCGDTVWAAVSTCENRYDFRIFRYGYEIRCQLDAASLRHIGHDFYADNSHVYLLRHDMDGYHYRPDLHILLDAKPASFWREVAIGVSDVMALIYNNR